MTKLAEIPWNKLTTIACLAQTYSPNCQFGKTALQKTVYLLGDLYDIDLGYRFDLHTYGPFCTDLLDDLEFAESLSFIQTERSTGSDWDYHIVPGNARCDDVTDQEFRTKLISGIQRLVEDFGRAGTTDLELFSTTVFVDRDLKRSGKTLQMDDFTNLIQEIKPRFSLGQIQSAIETLRSKGHLEQSEVAGST